MKKYYITITETLERTIEIVANDENEHISECNSIIDEIIEFLKEQRKEVKL